jgi:predicted ribosome quality control (RQC) complex YloA/Tae2 family protein
MADAKGMSSLDVRVLAGELGRELEGAFFRKAWQYGPSLLLEFFVPGKGRRLLLSGSDRIFLASGKGSPPKSPPGFPMLLRKRLAGERVSGIAQRGFDRVLELRTDSHVLVFELVPPGNAMLCDAGYGIIMPLRTQRWRGRAIAAREPYRLPPQGRDPLSLDEPGLSALLRGSPKKLAALLATDLGLGPLYGNEVCSLAGLDPALECGSLSRDDVLSLLKALRAVRDAPISPVAYGEAAAPFPLRSFLGKAGRPFPTFSEALESFFSSLDRKASERSGRSEAGRREARTESIIMRQRQALEEWKATERDSRLSGDLIYSRHPDVAYLLSLVHAAKRAGEGWDSIRKRLPPWVKEVREREGALVATLGGHGVRLDVRRTAEQNAALHYERAKKAKAKQAGIVSALAEQERRLSALRESEAGEPGSGTAQEPAGPGTGEPSQGRKGRWYEEYRWFLSSDGFLVAAGRNASQNEALLNRHALPDDPVFHADIRGAAFVVVSAEGREVPDGTLQEAARFSAAHCKAWSRGLGTVDIFSVRRSQLSKAAGLSRGSFVVKGQRTWYKNLPVRLSVGVVLHPEGWAEVVAGPATATRKRSGYLVEIAPGSLKPERLGREIKSFLLSKARRDEAPLIERLPLERFQSCLPSGTGGIWQG